MEMDLNNPEHRIQMLALFLLHKNGGDVVITNEEWDNALGQLVGVNIIAGEQRENSLRFRIMTRAEVELFMAQPQGHAN